MKELSLFTGAGGGVLGSKLLGWRTIGYVEKDAYCQKVILQRIRDGIFDDAPIFSDIGKFIDEGFADAYRDCIDVVSAGFPCQPFSVAGKRAGENDERNMWPETIECIRRVRPCFAFLENVPGLLANKYFGTILGDLAAAGFDVEGDVFSACECGAPHSRERLFLLAYTPGFKGWISEEFEIPKKALPAPRIGNTGPSPKPPQRYFQPRVWRTGNGMANRTHRSKSIGNGQVPIQMAYAFSILFRRASKLNDLHDKLGE